MKKKSPQFITRCQCGHALVIIFLMDSVVLLGEVWGLFYRQHFQKHFLHWKSLYLYFTEMHLIISLLLIHFEALIWTNHSLLYNESFKINFCEIWLKIWGFSFKNTFENIFPFCSSLEPMPAPMACISWPVFICLMLQRNQLSLCLKNKHILLWKLLH